MGKTATVANRFRMGWKSRHLVVIILAVAGTWGFLESRAEWSDMHRWNRAIGDMSFLLIAFSMAIGPLSRLVSRLKALVPWRRELGIYGVILATVHTIIILAGWIEWDLVRIFGFQLHPSGIYVMVQHGFGLANVIGLVALFYGIVLALSSSNWSQRLLGGSVWKFLQQGAYVLWMLIIVHTAYFLFLHFLDFHRSVPEPNWLQIPFSVLVSSVVSLQIAAFIKTWIARRNRAGSFEQAQTG